MVPLPVVLPSHLRPCWTEWAKLKPNALGSSVIQSKFGFAITSRNGSSPPIWHKNSFNTFFHPQLITSQLEAVCPLRHHAIGIGHQGDLHSSWLDLLPKLLMALSKMAILFKNMRLIAPFKMKLFGKEGLYPWSAAPMVVFLKY